jgi:hypothetical protein
MHAELAAVPDSLYHVTRANRVIAVVRLQQRCPFLAKLNIKGTVILIGTDANGGCVFSEMLPVLEYYERIHLWDDPGKVKRLKLANLKGYVFAPSGVLDQEFDTAFDAKTGGYQKCRTRFADGTIQESQ